MFHRLLTIGTFDIPHVGHAAFLQSCDAQADEVIVGVNSDDFIATYKGDRPIFNQNERLALIRELGYEQVVLNPGPGQALIKMYQPDCVAIGTDWLAKDYLAQIGLEPDWFTKTGTCLLYLPYTPGITTSDIRRRLTAPQW